MEILGEDFRTSKKEYAPSKPCEFYDDSDGDLYPFNKWKRQDLDTDMYGNPLDSPIYERAKRREARYLEKRCFQLIAASFTAFDKRAIFDQQSKIARFRF